MPTIVSAGRSQPRLPVGWARPRGPKAPLPPHIPLSGGGVPTKPGPTRGPEPGLVGLLRQMVADQGTTRTARRLGVEHTTPVTGLPHHTRTLWFTGAIATELVQREQTWTEASEARLTERSWRLRARRWLPLQPPPSRRCPDDERVYAPAWPLLERRRRTQTDCHAD